MVAWEDKVLKHFYYKARQKKESTTSIFNFGQVIDPTKFLWLEEVWATGTISTQGFLNLDKLFLGPKSSQLSFE